VIFGNFFTQHLFTIPANEQTGNEQQNRKDWERTEIL